MQLFQHRGAAIAITLASVLLCWSTSGAAQTAQDRAAAQALFDEGKALMKSNSPADACPKLEESLRLDPAIGTRFQLARCYELLGRTASAWNLYLEVAAETRKNNEVQREEFARKEAKRIEPKLTRLVIVVPEKQRDKGLVIERDGVEVGSGQWGVKVPVDPGSHVIKASAPGKKPWSTTIEVSGAGKSKTLTIPPLENAPVPESTDETTAPTPGAPPGLDQGSSGSTQRLVALGTGGLGVIGLALGGVFGLSAISKKKDADCDGNVCADNAARDTYESAQSAGNLATVGFIAGGALLAGGAILYFTAPSDESGSGQTVAQAGVRPTPGGVELTAGWSF